MTERHVPVLLAETISLLDLRPGGRYIDCTVGGAGHSVAILERTGPDGLLLALDADRQAVERARARLAPYGDRARVVHANFRALDVVAADFGPVDGVLMDLGLSSLQLSAEGRGFAFSHDTPLDMRFDQSRGETAADFLASASQAQIEDVLRTYGEEPRARRIAAEIVVARTAGPITTTGQLASLVSAAAGGRRGPTHPATRTFQALRILVNDELAALRESLPLAAALLRPGGRLAVISFHSLEDRIVKTFMRQRAGHEADPAPRGLPVRVSTAVAEFRILTQRPARPTAEETERNPRSRSARLRAAERL